MDRLNWFFEWSDRTNQDEKLTLRVVGSNLVQVQICDQRPICDSGPDGRIVIFSKGQTRPIRMKKITLEFEPCSGSKLIFDQRSIWGSRPAGQVSFFKRSDRTNQKVMSSNLVQVQKRLFDQRPILFKVWRPWLILERSDKTNQDEKITQGAGFEPCSGSNLWPDVHVVGFNPINCIFALVRLGFTFPLPYLLAMSVCTEF